MARIGAQRPTARTAYLLANRDFKREAVRLTTIFGDNSALRHVLKDPMTVVGRFLRVSGKDAKQERLLVSAVLAVLEAAPLEAKFIGTHAGRVVVAKRHKVETTIEFADVRSPYLPAL